MSVCVLGTYSEFKFKVQTLCLNKGMSWQLEDLSCLSWVCVQFSRLPGICGSLSRSTMAVSFLGSPRKISGWFYDCPPPPQYCSFSFRQLWCWSSSVVQHWDGYHFMYSFSSQASSLCHWSSYFTQHSLISFVELLYQGTLMGQGAWVPRWILQTPTVFTVVH